MTVSQWIYLTIQKVFILMETAIAQGDTHAVYHYSKEIPVLAAGYQEARENENAK